ncbi:MAG: MBOAT family protein [Phycisphaerae bacterium]
MNFNTLHFALFYAIVFPMVVMLRSRVRARNALLLVASYYFYGCWDYRFLALIIISTVVDYLCGLCFDVRQADPERPPIQTWRRRAILLTSIICNLGILGFFKYYDFFVTSAADLSAAIGLPVHLRTLRLILPVGISFYTFQTLSYTIDLYRGKITTERNLLNLAVFVAFFPQLVAGPIERASQLLPQVRTPRTITWKMLYSGFYLMGWGMFKKVVIADQVAPLVNMVFGAADPSGLEVLMGIYAFAIQAYCDFSGYTDIARGAARCMGFDLMLNFNLPYLATNPSDFWRRWHISLSTWLRDYLYIPLGGSRKGERRTYINLMLTMTLCGLWHGAAWTYVCFGAYHGVLLCAHRALRPWLERHIRPSSAFLAAAWHWTRVLICFHLVCLGWPIFRADTLTQAMNMLWALATDVTIWFRVVNAREIAILAACMLALFGVQLLQWKTRDLTFVFRLSLPVRAVAYASLFLGFIMFGSYGSDSFMYFQF